MVDRGRTESGSRSKPLGKTLKICELRIKVWVSLPHQKGKLKRLFGLCLLYFISISVGAYLLCHLQAKRWTRRRRFGRICLERGLVAAVNFQLRYAPNNLGAVALAKAGVPGDLHDMEVQVRTYTPWQLWTFLATAPRLEILYHSIHLPGPGPIVAGESGGRVREDGAEPTVR